MDEPKRPKPHQVGLQILRGVHSKRPREIPTRPLETVHQAEGNRISPEQEDDRDRTRGVPRLAGRWPGGDDKINAHPHLAWAWRIAAPA
jgi:hypothetical protein